MQIAAQSSRPRFTLNRTCDGYEVVDSRDGRPVTGSFDYANQPLKIAARLNDAWRQGHRALARALGCVDDEQVDERIGETVPAFCYTEA